MNNGRISIAGMRELNDSNFEKHLELLHKELHEHWLPLPGLGDAYTRHEAIKNAINRANNRAEPWVQHWRVDQEVRHLYAVVEALGAMANNVSCLSMLFAIENGDDWGRVKSLLRADLEEMYVNASECSRRSRLLLMAAPIGQEVFFETTCLSIQVEVLGILCIIRSENFTLLPNSVHDIYRKEISNIGLMLVTQIKKYRSEFLNISESCWLEAKLKSILDSAGEKVETTYFELAHTASDPGVALEIAKLEIADNSSLLGTNPLLELIDQNMQKITSLHGLWSEEHRRALASIQIMANAAILRTAQLGDRPELIAAGTWASALHHWSAGNSIPVRRGFPPAAHFIASDKFIGRICTNGDLVEYKEAQLGKDFWSSIWNLHRNFDDKNKELELIQKSARLSIMASLKTLLDLPDDSLYQTILHGRTALVPWFTLFEDGQPWAIRTVGGTSVGSEIRENITEAKRKYLAIIDVSIGSHSRKVIDLWKNYSKCSDEDLILIDSTKESSISVLKLLSEIQNTEEVLFFGHGNSQIMDFRKSGLLVGSETLISAIDIATLNLSSTNRLFLIACGSGQANLGVPVSSMSGVFSARGVSNVVSTLWSIQSTVGKDFLESCLSQLRKSDNFQEAWALTIQKNPGRFGYFTLTSNRL